MIDQADTVEIQVLEGLRFTPEMFLKKMDKSKKLKNQSISCRYVTTVYGLCWIFQFRVKLMVSKKTSRYIGYYAGFDETVMSPGKLAKLPSAGLKSVDSRSLLPVKLSEEAAVHKAWEYNKMGMIRKYRILQNPPVLEDVVTDRYWKPLYVMEFCNEDLGEKKYRLLDSLTGDLTEFQIQ